MHGTSCGFWTRRQRPVDRFPAKAGTQPSTVPAADKWIPAFAGKRESISLPLRIGIEFRHIRVHVVPRLSAFDEDVGVGPEPARVVEARDADADQVGPGRDLNIERRAAIAAKHTRDV